ncbi:MAG: alpha/beta hydrolase [Chitinophagales bacterium]|nr:alpha/beta hydrolase [Bacteroidota bacterium]MCB9043984.1 alpha/beta hydrolase [Chitinophagales bacterium]
MAANNFEIRESNGFKYVEKGKGEKVLLLLHGLFGALSNFESLIEHFSKDYTVSIPLLPIYEMPLEKTSVKNLAEYVRSFVEYKGYAEVIPIGNSLGGHIALLYTLNYPESVKALVLTGSSGLFESAMGDSFPKRGDYDYIRKKTEDTFYDPQVATKELVDEVFDIVNDREKVIRVLAMAKSAIRQNMADLIPQIENPTLLIWGADDKVTPAFVGEEFHKLLKNSELIFIPYCGHAAMMERPDEFNKLLESYLSKLIVSV